MVVAVYLMQEKAMYLHVKVIQLIVVMLAM